MLGMEMMFSNMIGMKPEELQLAVKGTMQSIHKGVQLMQEINTRCIDIQNRLDKLEGNTTNGQRKLRNDNNRNSDSHIQL